MAGRSPDHDVFAECPAGAAALAWSLARMLLWPRGEGAITCGERMCRFPLPRPCTLLRAAERRAAYLSWRRVGMQAWLSRRAPDYGWNYQEQLGSVHVLTGEGRRLIIQTRQCARYLMLLDCMLAEG